MHNRKPIAEFLRKDLPGWEPMQEVLDIAFPLKEHPYSCVYINKDGIQLNATIKQQVPLMIHASISPVYSLRPELGKDEFDYFVLCEAGNILKTFFGDKRFVRAPDDSNSPHLKHYFHMLDGD